MNATSEVSAQKDFLGDRIAAAAFFIINGGNIVSSLLAADRFNRELPSEASHLRVGATSFLDQGLLVAIIACITGGLMKSQKWAMVLAILFSLRQMVRINVLLAGPMPTGAPIYQLSFAIYALIALYLVGRYVISLKNHDLRLPPRQSNGPVAD